MLSALQFHLRARSVGLIRSSQHSATIRLRCSTVRLLTPPAAGPLPSVIPPMAAVPPNMGVARAEEEVPERDPNTAEDPNTDEEVEVEGVVLNPNGFNVAAIPPNRFLVSVPPPNTLDESEAEAPNTEEKLESVVVTPNIEVEFTAGVSIKVEVGHAVTVATVGASSLITESFFKDLTSVFLSWESM